MMLLMDLERPVILIQLGLSYVLACETLSAETRPATSSTWPPYPILCVDPSRGQRGRSFPPDAASVFFVICSPHKI